jgi:signal transduction histidine kinase
MQHLLDELLTLAQSNRDIGDVESTSLTSLVEQCWHNVPTADADLETQSLGAIYADENRLTQLFENLFTNAVEHGSRSVDVTVGMLSDGFYIEDDGQGIAQEIHDTVLEAGFSSDTDGTGFGLSIVRTITEAHGWDLSITESASGGARFEITEVGRGYTPTPHYPATLPSSTRARR